MKIYTIQGMPSTAHFASEEAALKYIEIRELKANIYEISVLVSEDGYMYEEKHENLVSTSAYGKLVELSDVENYARWYALSKLSPIEKTMLGLE